MLSVGVFSFSLICKSSAAQFQTFVPHGKQTLMNRDSPSLRKMQSLFFRRLATFGNVSPFLVGATNIFSELIDPRDNIFEPPGQNLLIVWKKG